MKKRIPFRSFDLFQGRVYCLCWEDCIQDGKTSRRDFVKDRLATHLVDLLHKNRRHERDIEVEGSETLKLSKTRFGKPILISAQQSALTVSFSYVQADAWAAISEFPWACGVDAASAREFDHKFPVEKVFSPDEFEAGRLIEKDRNSLIAFLWSAKESVVKAVGCGFHLIAPRAIELSIVSGGPDLLRIVARLHGPSNDRGFLCSSANIAVESFRRGSAWISVALRQQTQPSLPSSS
ncbi:MAG: 4'-phosphopantetheinyl transferase superfamily protein [Desulfomonilaceae bacterium]